MKWCAHCKKYVEARVEKIENPVIEWTFFTYHCISCNAFIESRQLSEESKEFL